MDCLNETTLALFIDRRMPSDRAGEVEGHIDACPTCRDLVAALARGTPHDTANGATLPAVTARYDSAALAAVDPEHYVDRVEITRGGMGRIVAARDLRLQRTVAIKELRMQSARLRARFAREALLTARLQHPSIVSVHEAGVWPSGEPFYAMELVPGRSLDEVVAATTSIDERLALLPHVLAVADALAYAHGQRVIHRDLKPHNILCGKFGETVVIDWGLGKDLDDASPDPGADAAHAEDPSATEAGEVLGTPAYMPPEQADGRTVDERADVYAIGAVLYHVLAGRSPYTGTSSLEILAAVRSGPPTPLDDRLALDTGSRGGLPHDLLAIVARAMARDPAGRYATARELAEDLRRFQSGQLVGAHRYSLRQLLRRWLSRHRTAVTIAGIASVLAIVFGILGIRRIVDEQRKAEAERELAEQQRALAEKHRADADELMDFMLGDLRRKLDPIGKIELLDSVAQKARAHYQQPSARPEDERRRAAALHNIGAVLLARGDANGALVEYRAARAIIERLEVQAPALATPRDLAVNHMKVGDALRYLGDVAGALGEYRASLALDAKHAARVPADVTAQHDLAVSHQRVGAMLLEQGDATSALVEYRAGLRVLTRVSAADPANAELHHEVSIAHTSIGGVLAAQGDATAAIAEFRAALAVGTKLVAADPENTELKRYLGINHHQIGDMLRASGDIPGALAEHRAGLTISAALAAHDPTNAEWTRELSISHERVGILLEQHGELGAALVEYRAAVAIRDKLVTAQPTNARLLHDLGQAHGHVGEVLEAQKHLAEALAAFRTSLVLAERVAAADPKDGYARLALAVSHASIADTLAARRERVAAAGEYRIAVELLEKLVADDPANAQWKTALESIRGDAEQPARSK